MTKQFQLCLEPCIVKVFAVYALTELTQGDRVRRFQSDVRAKRGLTTVLLFCIYTAIVNKSFVNLFSSNANYGYEYRKLVSKTLAPACGPLWTYL